MKLVTAILVSLSLAGCATLENAGYSAYSVTPECQVVATSGKEVASVEVHINKQGTNCSVDLKEQGVKAFAGQAISADSLKSVVDAAVKAALAAAGLLVP